MIETLRFGPAHLATACMSGLPQGLEPAVKHTYICHADEWISEQCNVSIAQSSFARGAMRRCHLCFETVQEGTRTYSVESVAKFSTIHRDARSAKTAAFADAKMQMVAEVRSTNMRSVQSQPACHLVQPRPAVRAGGSTGRNSSTASRRHRVRWPSWWPRCSSCLSGPTAHSDGRASSRDSTASQLGSLTLTLNPTP